MNPQQIERIPFAIAWTAALAGLIILLLSGCGHNAMSFFDGADASLEPSAEKGFSAHLRYGQAIQIVMKEKSKASITISREQAGGTGIKNNDKVEIVFETGDQTNGYVVELEKMKSGGSAAP